MFKFMGLTRHEGHNNGLWDKNCAPQLTVPFGHTANES